MELATAHPILSDPQWRAWSRHEPQQPLDCEAIGYDIDFADDDSRVGDPFDVELLMTGHTSTGQEVDIWLRLTPSVITDLQNRLAAVIAAQRQALGVVVDPTPAAHVPGPDLDTDTDTDEETDIDVSPASRMHRIVDPLGVRSMLQTSTAKAHIIITAAIVALVLLAVIIRITS